MLKDVPLNHQKRLRILRECRYVFLRGGKWRDFLFDIVEDDYESEEPRPHNPPMKGNYIRSEWFTYEDCLQLTVCYENAERIRLEYSVYHGDILDGSPASLRFRWACTVPVVYLQHFDGALQRSLRNASAMAWEEHINQWRQEWMAQF